MSQGVCGHSNTAGQSEWAIFSTNQEPSNIERLEKLLLSRVVAYKRVLGQYNGKAEISFLVKAGQVEDIKAHGFLEGQESVLFLEACNARGLRKAWLVNLQDDSRKELGYFGSYTSKLPDTGEDYTFDPVTGCVYTIREYHSATDKPLSKIPAKVQASYEEYRKRVAG